MIQLNVIDLDKTLIPYDSFNTLFYYYLKKPNCFFYLTLTGILRSFKVISGLDFARRVYNKVKSQSDFEIICQKTAADIKKNADVNVLNLIKKHTDKETVTLLCSASPIDYVAIVANSFNWNFAGSNFDNNGVFFHMYGANKLNFIKLNYPPEKYFYNFSISDSESDSQLLAIFKHKILYKND